MAELRLQQARIGQIAIVCKDVARAKAFYSDTLGLKHLFDAGPSLSFFESGGTRLMLSLAEGNTAKRSPSAVLHMVRDEDTRTFLRKRDRINEP